VSYPFPPRSLATAGGALLCLLLLAPGCSFDRAGLFTTDSALGDTDGIQLRDSREHEQRQDAPAADAPAADAPAADGRADLAPSDVSPPADVGPCPGGCDPALGCNTAAGRCFLLKPSTLTASEFDTLYGQAKGDCDLSPASAQLIDIDTDSPTFASSTVHSTTFARAGMPVLRVYAFNTLTVGGNATLRFSGDHALLIYAKRTITVDGTIDGYADEETPGPGGARGGEDDGDHGLCWFNGGHGRGGGEKNADDDSGGGGGAGGQDGAKGGDSGGLKGGDGGKGKIPGQLFELFGGCGGGAGGGSDDDGGSGGAGGGAIHLAAGESLTVNGTINVGGGGGDGGHQGDAGGGGGGGGTLLLESLSVSVNGVAAANGGGGGAGAKDPNDNGAKDGDDGHASASQASGGASSGGDSGHGGKGGTGAKGAEKGENKKNGGGGGGGAGRIHIRAPSSQLNGVISPKEILDASFDKI
jgi:hypothetical protein